MRVLLLILGAIIAMMVALVMAQRPELERYLKIRSM